MPALVPPVVPEGFWGRASQPVLSDDGLTLRPWTVGDVDILVSAYADPEIQRWHGRSMSPDEAADWIESRGVRWRQETGADWAVTTAADVVGRVGFRTLHLDEGRAEVAYWIAPPARGRRLAARSLAVLSEWALGPGNLHRLDLLHSTQNAASCRVAELCGYHVEGTARSSTLHADGWHDMHVHAKTTSQTRRPTG